MKLNLINIEKWGERGGKVNQTLPLQMILQFIVGYTCSTFQISEFLEILKYVFIQHMYPSTSKARQNSLLYMRIIKTKNSHDR